MKITFFVPGIPKTAGSKRGIPIYRGKKGNKQFTGKVVVIEDCKKSADWRGDVIKFASEAYSGPLITSAIWLRVNFLFSRPKNHFGTGKNKGTLKKSAPEHHLVKPDALKLMRAVEDALMGIIYKDDAQVIHPDPYKMYVRGTRKPGAEFEIEF